MSPRSWFVRIAALAALVLASSAGAARAETDLTLLPGTVSGDLVPYHVHRYDSLADIALRFRVNPVRVEYDGHLYRGKLVHVDSRAIVPSFPDGLSGIVLNLPEAEVYYVQHGRLIHRYPVAVAREDKPVPIGDTQVVSMDVNPTWVVPESIQAEMAKEGKRVITEVPPGPDDPLGPRFIGFWNGRFGFHGTNEPYSIKHYVSHGCVRFLPHDIIDLYRRVHMGTPVHVLYQPVTLAADKSGVYVSVFPDMYHFDYNYRGIIARLARAAGVSDRVDWAKVAQAIRWHSGFVVDVARAVPTPHARPIHKPSPHPKPSHKPKPTPKPSPVPVETPVATVTVPLEPTATPASSSSWWDRDAAPSH